MRPNPVKKKLAKGERVFGTMIFEFASPGLPAMVKAAGADFILYDMEHSGLTLDQIKQQLALCRGLGLTPLVRPPAKQYQQAAVLLDAGALGLMFPMVESREEAEELVSWTRYPPKGVRGAAFGIAHDDFEPGDVKKKMKTAADRCLVLALIETAKGLENIDEILAVPGIDVAHLGHFDLSLSLGHPGEFEHPEVKDAIKRIAKTAKKHGKPAACMVPDVAWGKDWMKLGFSMISYSGDVWLMQNALSDGIAGLKTR